MSSSLSNALFSAVGLVVLAYPVLYWSFVRTKTRWLLVCASYGLPVFVALLAAGVLLPLQVFAIKMAPQLEAGGYLQAIWPLISGGEAILEFGWLAAFALYLASPPLLHWRYTNAPLCASEQAIEKQ